MSYIESAHNGEIVNTSRYAIINGSLWAVGISWSTAIRAIVITIIPKDTREVIIGEILAAAITTCLAVAIAIIVGKGCKRTYSNDRVTNINQENARVRHIHRTPASAI